MTLAPVQEVEKQALTLPDEAKLIRVTNDSEYEAASMFLRFRVKAMREEIDRTFDPIIRAAHQTHKEALARKAEVEKPVVAAESTVKHALILYARQKDEERRRMEAVLRQAAQEQAEKEALDRAALLERQGRQAEAEAILAQPIEAPAVVAPEGMGAPKAAGVSIRKTYTFRIRDRSKIKPEYLVPDEVKIGKVVRALKEQAELAVGGIEVVVEEVVGARA